MARFIEIKDLDKLIKKLHGVSTVIEVPKEIFDEIGLFLTSAIEVRTAMGKDVKGKVFKPYSPRYAKFRADAGHPVDKVNLFFTGSMMGALTHEASTDKVRIFFMPTEDKSGVSNPAKAYYLNEDRHFFGISDDERKEIAKIFADYIHEEMVK